MLACGFKRSVYDALIVAAAGYAGGSLAPPRGLVRERQW
jgi:hypothetical protein